MMTKLVNGTRVTLSPEEENKIRSEWEANRKEALERKALKEKSKVAKEQAKQKLMSSSGLSAEEIQLLLGK